MIANLIGGFVSILVGVSLIGPLSNTVGSMAGGRNASGGTCTAAIDGTAGTNSANCALGFSSSWGSTVLNLVPGFFALGILGIGLAVTYSSLRQAGVV